MKNICLVRYRAENCQISGMFLDSKLWPFKGYLRYKTVLCNKVALDVQLMNFFL